MCPEIFQNHSTIKLRVKVIFYVTCLYATAGISQYRLICVPPTNTNAMEGSRSNSCWVNLLSVRWLAVGGSVQTEFLFVFFKSFFAKTPWVFLKVRHRTGRDPKQCLPSWVCARKNAQGSAQRWRIWNNWQNSLSCCLQTKTFKRLAVGSFSVQWSRI